MNALDPDHLLREAHDAIAAAAGRPAPMTPPDCDLSDFEFMPVMVRRLLKSETWSLGTGDERAAAVALWFESWHQVPAASLPNDDRLLKRLADSDKWARVKQQALRGWVQCSDGRLYHQIVAQKALEAWIEKLMSAAAGAVTNSKRWGAALDRPALLAKLQDAIERLALLAPASKTLKKAAVVKAIAGVLPGESGGDHKTPSPPDPQRVSPPESPPCRNREGEGQREGEGEGFGIPELRLLPETDAVGGPAQTPAPPPALRCDNAQAIPKTAIVPLASDWKLPESWGNDAEALGFKPAEILREAERFRQYWVSGKGAGGRKSLRGWRQAWSNWLAKAEPQRRTS